MFTRNFDSLVVLGKDLKIGRIFISVSYFALVTFERSKSDRDCLANCFYVLLLSIKLVQDESTLFLVSRNVLMAFIDNFKGSIYNLMSPDSNVTMLLSKQIQVWTNLEPNEKLVFENSSDHTQATSIRAIFNWFDYGSHSD